MNYKTNWYGAVGLISTIGKNSFAAGEAVSGWVKGGCHYVQKVVEIDAAVIGPVFNRLENAFESIESFDKSAKEWFQEKETLYNEKHEQAKKQEELNEDWEWNVNWEHTVNQVQKSPYWKAHRKFYSLMPKTTCLPSCFTSWRRV